MRKSDDLTADVARQSHYPQNVIAKKQNKTH